MKFVVSTAEAAILPKVNQMEQNTNLTLELLLFTYNALNNQSPRAVTSKNISTRKNLNSIWSSLLYQNVSISAGIRETNEENWMPEGPTLVTYMFKSHRRISNPQIKQIPC